MLSKELLKGSDVNDVALSVDSNVDNVLLGSAQDNLLLLLNKKKIHIQTFNKKSIEQAIHEFSK